MSRRRSPGTPHRHRTARCDAAAARQDRIDVSCLVQNACVPLNDTECGWGEHNRVNPDRAVRDTASCNILVSEEPALMRFPLYRLVRWSAIFAAALAGVVLAGISPQAVLVARQQTATAALPARLTDAEFWSLVGAISEPGGSFRITDNFTSNEGEIGRLATM